MEFSCSLCKYTSNKKENVTRHISRKNECGIGTKEIIEIPIEIKCEYCNKNYSSVKNLNFHKNNHCKHKDAMKDAKIKELEEKINQKDEVKDAKIKELEEKINQISNIKLDRQTDNIEHNYIYLIKIYPYEDGVYKIGRTSDINKRLSMYKKYKIIFISICINDIEYEKEILEIFKSKYVKCKDMGNEYFYANCDDIKNTIVDYFHKKEI